ncbi:nicotinate phosphoribosyltransferase [Marinicella meishanensis]|uniref:nicotinate phosphoribosyltransferase n=1 Tax=Marinicella meishanensis TaxID=2873263 RepID=UPI001CBB54B5|nr:nicotinate phosphoribosyltransferase [Marinicella sp. NBU2979]
MNNLILNTDSYKTSHYLQYPPGTQYVSSYIESRGGEFTASLFFGLQMFIKQYLTHAITREDIDEAAALYELHGVPFNQAGWEHILQAHQGLLPIKIEAIKEGTVLPTRNVMVQIINTDPACAWLTCFVETALLRAIWYPTTVATVSHACKQVIAKYMRETAGHTEGLAFKLHDFGARGVSSLESAAIGGLAHLVNFQGTDTVSALVQGRQFYGEAMAGFSIPASEHSTMTSWGQSRETEAYQNMLEQYGGPGKTVAVVSDSYDIWHAIDHIWGRELRQQVINHGGTLVVRPDSGDPVSMVSDVIERLMKQFGHRYNAVGFKVLPDFLRVIQGDGVSLTTIEQILVEMKRRQLSVENIAFGMGAELLQKVNRDTLKFAMKASAVGINGEWIDVYKDPITDPGKKSKAGRLALIQQNGQYQTIRASELSGRQNLLKPVFLNGRLLKECTLKEVRAQQQLTGQKAA